MYVYIELKSPHFHVMYILMQIWSDGWFAAGIDEYLRKRLLEKKSMPVGPTYVYLFAHKGSASFTEIFKGGQENYFGKFFRIVLLYFRVG